MRFHKLTYEQHKHTNTNTSFVNIIPDSVEEEAEMAKQNEQRGDCRCDRQPLVVVAVEVEAWCSMTRFEQVSTETFSFWILVLWCHPGFIQDLQDHSSIKSYNIQDFWFHPVFCNVVWSAVCSLLCPVKIVICGWEPLCCFLLMNWYVCSTP